MSKELEALECIVVDLTPIAKEHNKEEIEQLKKSLEALEIIKEKRVYVRYLQLCENLRQYNNFVEMNWSCRKEAEYHHDEILTQEEYDLLKEVLLCVKN